MIRMKIVTKLFPSRTSRHSLFRLVMGKVSPRWAPETFAADLGPTAWVLRSLPLLIANGARSNQLNASPSERFSAVLAYAVLISLLASFWTPWLGLAAVAIFVGLYIFFNHGLFRLIAQRGRARGLFAGITLHWLYHLYASTIFTAVQATAQMRVALAAVRRILARHVSAHDRPLR
jgi:hypothetical protein